MNERIKKLAEQSGFYFYDLHDVDGEDLGETIEADSWCAAEKFAKLIVQECAFYMYENYPYSRYEVNFMRRHMGDPDWNKPIKDQLESNDERTN